MNETIESQTARVADDNYFRRTQELLNPGILRTKTVGIVGAGSVGSRAAMELARAGVDHLLLFEKPGELLEEHNIVRHELGYSSLGKPKARELVLRLRDIRPPAKVEVCELDVVAQLGEFAQAAQGAGVKLLLGCTDTDESRFAINQTALQLGVPAIFAAVYDNGVGGEVFAARPGAACYGCFHARLRPHAPPRQRRRSLDYANPDYQEYRAIAALNLDIQQIALLQARVALATLLAPECFFGQLPGNLIVFANQEVEGVFARPLHAEFYDVPPAPSCLVCGSRGADLTPAATEELERLLAEAQVEAK